MKASILDFLSKEPYQSAIVTGFAALGSAAIFNIASQFVLGSASAPGASGFLLAGAVSVVAGTIAGLRAASKSRNALSDLQLAEKLANGDFSAFRRDVDKVSSPLAVSLNAIAERQLQTDTAHARLTNDASMRQDQLFSALDSVADEVTVYDKQGLLVAANKAFSRRCNSIGAVVAPGMLQLEVLNALAKSPGADLPMNERDSWLKLQGELRENCLQLAKPVRFTRFDGTQATMSVEKTSDGNHIEIIRDVAAETELEARAVRAENEAAASDRIKAVTLSRLSHTIRTPMTGVLTAAELMAKSDLDDLQRSRLDIIRRSASTLLGVVQDMFDLAEDAKESAKAKEKSVEIPARRAILFAPEQGQMDGVRALLVAQGYEVALAETAHLAAEAAAQLSVSSRPVAMIVAPDDANARDVLIELSLHAKEPHPPVKLPGDILAGTTLMATNQDVPESTAAEIPTPDAPTLSNGNADILVVEDDDVNQIVYSQVLSGMGHSFAIAGTGSQALELVAAHCPALILMDVSMPGMNGIEATKRIREMTANHTRQPLIIGMTNHYLGGDKGKCLAAGMNEYALKPEAASMLKSSIEHWLTMEPLKKVG